MPLPLSEHNQKIASIVELAAGPGTTFYDKAQKLHSIVAKPV